MAAHQLTSGSYDPDETNVEVLRKAQSALKRRMSRLGNAHSDADDWDRFYERYKPMIERFMRDWEVRETDWDEVGQDVWAALCQKLPDFQYDPSRGRFRSWLYSLVFHKAVDLVRRRTRHATERLGDLIDAGLEPADPTQDPVAEYEQRQQQELLRRGLDELRQHVFPNSFTVFHMLNIEGRSVAEVCRVHGLKPEEVWVINCRMKQKLRGIVGAYVGKDIEPGR